MAGHADVLFWALILENRKRSQEERNDREPGCPLMELLLPRAVRASFPQIGSQEPGGVGFRSGQGTESVAGMLVQFAQMLSL